MRRDGFSPRHVSSGITILLLSATAWAAAPGTATTHTPQPNPPLQACFAPGTPWRVVEDYAQRIGSSPMITSLQQSLIAQQGNFQMGDGDRWTATATDGSGLRQGDPTTITWSIVPDGTPVAGYIGEQSNPSNLRGWLDSTYGSEAQWLPIFEGVFERWGELTGISYVYVDDDGAAMTAQNLPGGQLGVRGDVRIAGHRLDGTGGVLAYNFFPSFGGDMVIDTADGVLSNTNGNSIRLRNTVAHEHGHGLGLSHVCPVNETKLLEPFLSLAFDGPQHDDILAANRGYGDRLETNDGVAIASTLGSFLDGEGDQLATLSIDDNSDSADMLAIEVPAGSSLSATVTPLGSTYRSGPQLQNGQCSGGTDFNSLAQQDLSIQVLGSDGVSVLGSAASAPIGQPEMLNDVPLSQGAGTYYLRVVGSGANAAQLYDLSFGVSSDPVQAPIVYESTTPDDILNPLNSQGPTNGNPHMQTPSMGSPLYYQLDDGSGDPALIQIVKSGADLAIHY